MSLLKQAAEAHIHIHILLHRLRAKQCAQLGGNVQDPGLLGTYPALLLGRSSHCSSAGEGAGRRIPGESFLILVLRGRALRGGYPTQLFRKVFSL